jgi:serine/threonine protein kinase
MLGAMADETVPWTPEDGERVVAGRYRLVERLGRGAVADVWRGMDDRLQRPVAVKLFRGDAAEQLQRHEAEMRTLARLDHPSLVTVYDAGEDAGSPYLVMQLVEGETLADELREGKLPGERTARYGAALADALAYVHAQGFVHRDVKPANVLIAADGRVHLADFGIARLVDSAHVTRTGEVLGTPAYFAPEQVSGGSVGPGADVYALGMILLECLTGRRPFDGTAMEVAMARLSRDPDVPATLPQAWQDVLRAMTARDAAARPASAEVADALRRLASGVDLDRTVALAPAPAPDHTAVLPSMTSVLPPSAAPVAAPIADTGPRRPAPRRRAVSPVAVAAIVLVALTIAAVAYAISRQSSSSSTSFTPGTPRLHQPLENDVEQLEKLVRR